MITVIRRKKARPGCCHASDHKRSGIGTIVLSMFVFPVFFVFSCLACFMASPAFPFPSGVLANAGVPIGENKTTVTASDFQSVFEIFTTCLKISFNNSFRIKTEMMFHAWFPQPSVWKNWQVMFAFFNLIFSLFHRPVSPPGVRKTCQCTK